MKGPTALAAILAVAMLSAALASIHCQCNRPGAEGKVIGFDCSIGEAVNLSFYTESEPALGQKFEFWAIKELEGNYVPAKNLDVRVALDSRELLNLISNENGYLSFTIEEAGSYEISGGDAVLSFEVEAEDPQEPSSNSTEDMVDAGGNANDEGKSAGEVASEIPPPEPKKLAKTEFKAGGGGGLPYLLVAAAILFATALIALLIKKKKINI